MASWKKVITSGSDISQLNNDAGYLIADQFPNAFSTASFDGVNLLADSLSGTLNFASSSGQGLTISASVGNDTLTFGLLDIPNTSLENSSIMFDGTSYALGVTGSILDGSGVWSGSAQLPSGIISSSDQIDGSVGNIDTTSFTGSFSGSFNGVFEGINLNVAVSGASFNNYAIDLASQYLILSQSDNNILLNVATIGETSKIGFSLSDAIFGDIIFADDVTVVGDLTVNGTVTTINSTNLNIEDRFILLNSGSNTGDGGIVVQSGSNGKGELLGWDYSSQRWGFGHSFDSNTTGDATYFSFVPEVYPGGNTVNTPAGITYEPLEAKGNIFIGDNQSIWIYS